MTRFALIELRRGQGAIPEGNRLVAKGDDIEEVVLMASLKAGVDIERPVADGGDDGAP